MKIVVCIKEVFNSDDVKIDKKTNNIDRRGAELFINPYDLNAVELALELKEKFGAETYAITMGIPSAENSLRECLAMGIDKGILITDRALAGSDTIATSLALAETIRKYVPGCDLILCGKHAIDAETSIVWPAIAERLGIAQLTYVDELVSLESGKITVKKASENGDLEVEAKLPAMISVTGEVNKPRYMDLKNIRFAVSSPIDIVGTAKLGLAAEAVGVPGSPTVVGEMHMVERSQGACVMLSGSTVDIARKIAELARAAAK